MVQWTAEKDQIVSINSDRQSLTTSPVANDGTDP